MPLPWLRILDAAIGLTSLARRVSTGSAARADPDHASLPAWGAGQLEARLAGVVVSALKEAFDRDHTRLEIEREQVEAERQRAERALRLELARQSGERELSRLRLLAGVAVASWLGTLFFFSGTLAAGGLPGRVTLGIGWLLLLGALGTAFAGQSRVARALDQISGRFDNRADLRGIESSGSAGAAAPWLIVAGLGAIAFGVLLG